MKRTLLAVLLCGFAAVTLAQTPPANAPSPPAPAAAPAAQNPTCKSQAADKKLAGAALTSFMKKCQADATASCNTAATDKKLAGAAKTSFTKKCVSDAVGT
jgi:hypothetical protein